MPKEYCKRGHKLEGYNLAIYPDNRKGREGKVRRVCRACKALHYQTHEGGGKARLAREGPRLPMAPFQAWLQEWVDSRGPEFSMELWCENHGLPKSYLQRIKNGTTANVYRLSLDLIDRTLIAAHKEGGVCAPDKLRELYPLDP